MIQGIMAMTKPAFIIGVVASLACSAQPVSFTTHYISQGPQDSLVAIVADSGGNIFVVAGLWGFGIRVTKTDPLGNVTASMDFAKGVRPYGAALDPQGNLVVVGASSTVVSNVVVYTTFIARIDSALTTTMATANSLQAQPTAVTVDAAGNVYVAGSSKPGFPTTSGAYQPSPASGAATYGFIAIFSPDLSSILYATFYGGSAADCQFSDACGNPFGGPNLPPAGTAVNGIALDSSGSVVIAGSSDGFSVALGITPYAVGFVAKFSPDLSSLQGIATFSNAINFPTYFQGLAVDSAGNIVVVGATYNGADFPPSSLQAKRPGNGAAGIVMKFDGSLKNRLWQTFFGGVDIEPPGVAGVAADSQDNIWITGVSIQSLLPNSTSSSIVPLPFVAELTSDGSSLLNLVSSQFGGVAIAMVPGSGPAVLGPVDSFLLSASPDQPAMLMVANSANNTSSGTIAPAELISLYGTGIGPQTPLQGQIIAGNFTRNLNGYRVMFNGDIAPVLYAGPNQINVVASGSIADYQSVKIEVLGPSGTTVFPTVFVGTARPQIFSREQPFSYPPGDSPEAMWYAIANNQDGTLNSAANPAAPGSIVTLWATGTGFPGEPVPDGSTNTTASAVNLPITATWSGQPVQVLYAGQAPGEVLGLTQINLQVPSTAGGPFAPFFVSLQLGGAPAGYALIEVSAK
jgi:uncharacterized protein (TIGR03437 family)